jgi:asparagine synthase (glutamine-hydrolysing)
MCGIGGILDETGGATSPHTLAAMAASLAHRGPDGQGVWRSPEGRLGLVSTRLAVIDPQGGRQPLHSPDGRYALVFNGEIYNHRELRAELAGLGHHFQTSSDTEVLLHACMQWGDEALPRLRGMFAFALYDATTRELLLARDRVGIKPLYYAPTAGGLVFGSELKALLCTGIRRRLNPAALLDFLVLGYAVAPATFFADALELPPACLLRASDGGIKVRRWWSWRRQPQSWSLARSLEETEAALSRSLQEHLVSDVPVGAFLSGGIDSSLLVALLVRNLGVELQTFNVAFREPAYDESPYARQVAHALGLRHHEIVVDLGKPDLELAETVLRQFDQPFGDSSAIPTYLVCREIRRSVKVALGGDGGDEMFGGYRRFWYADVAHALGRLPRWSLSTARHAAEALHDSAPGLLRQSQRLLRAAAAGGGERLMVLSSYNAPAELATIVAPPVLRAAGEHRPAFGRNGDTPQRGDGRDFIDATVRYVLPGDYLRKIDLMSNAHGLEVRVPYLGEHVLECAARLPRKHLYSARENKRLLRRLAARCLPLAVAQRPKVGFGIPLDTWLGREGRRAVAAMLLAPDARIRALLLPAAMDPLVRSFAEQRWDKARDSRFNVYQRVYFLWSLELWLQQWKPEL